MSKFADSPFEGHLEVIATLSGGVINASIRELRERDRLTIALRQSLRNGVSINDLSAASGLTVEEIERRCAGELHFGEDMASLTGC